MASEHDPFVREAIHLAEEAVANGDEPFGALLVKDGEIVLRARNTIYTGKDATNHAEMNLVRLALARFDADFLSECTLYTSTEPCAMCAGAIYWSGVRRVVFACSEKRLGELGTGGLDVPCREILLRGSHPVEVVGPILEEEAVRTHQNYW